MIFRFDVLTIHCKMNFYSNHCEMLEKHASKHFLGLCLYHIPQMEKSPAPRRHYPFHFNFITTILQINIYRGCDSIAGLFCGQIAGKCPDVTHN